MKKNGILVAGVVFLTILLSITVLLSSASAKSGNIKTLKIGATWPMHTALGLETKKCFDLIIPQFNKAGGLVIQGQRYNIEMITYDDKYKAEVARAAAERLVFKDKVKYILQLGSAPTAATLPVTEPEKVIVLSGCTTEKITDPANHYCARTATSFTAGAAMWRNLAKAHPELKTMVTLAPDEEGGRARTKTDTSCAKSYGIKILDNLYFPPRAADFAPMATKIASLKPDLVTYPRVGAGTQFGLILKALYESGWSGVHMSPTVPKIDEVLAVTSKESMEGLVHKIWPTDLAKPPKEAAELKELYVNKYGTWSEVGVTWVNGFYCFVAAAKKADSLNTDKIIAALNGLEFDCPAGHAMMIKRPDRKNYRAVDFVVEQILTQSKAGKRKVIGTLSTEEGVTALEKIFGQPGQWR